MSISLVNRKNTNLCFTDAISSLFHHGSETCRIEWISNTVTISLCGWDTLTTRGKIGAFLRIQDVRDISIHRVKGETMLSREGFPDLPLAPRDVITIRLGSLAIIQD